MNEQRRVRPRQSSLSIVYSDNDARTSPAAGYDWRLTLTSRRVNESDTESVYSAQVTGKQYTNNCCIQNPLAVLLREPD